MSDRTDQQAAIESLGAPAGREVVERVTAERLTGQPHLRAVGTAEASSPADRVAELESQLAEERTARRNAESAAGEMAVLIARVRTELAEARRERAAAEQTAGEMAGLLAQEHERARRAEDELRLAWAQVPMVDQRELGSSRAPVAARMKRAIGR